MILLSVTGVNDVIYAIEIIERGGETAGLRNGLCMSSQTRIQGFRLLLSEGSQFFVTTSPNYEINNRRGIATSLGTK